MAALNDKVKIKWQWWVYVAIVCAFGYGRMIERLARESGGFWSQFGPPIGATLVCIGIFCWLTSTALLNVCLWRAVHACLGIAQVIGLVFSVYLAALSVYVSAGVVFLATLIFLPAFYALFQYSYRSQSLWGDT